METALFDYHLPKALIAQIPSATRSKSRLLILSRNDGSIEHRTFQDIGTFLHSEDTLVANNTRVIPARLYGLSDSGKKTEIFLIKQLDATDLVWECLIRGRSSRRGKIFLFTTPSAPNLRAEIIASSKEGVHAIRFSSPLSPLLSLLGEMPLPPYISSFQGDPERYQTVYSEHKGSVAAPTAGLHFTSELLKELKKQGIAFETLTLHVGLGTFKPVKTANIEDHLLHKEDAELSPQTAELINARRAQGGRTVAIGTTSVRTLEWAASGAQGIDPYGKFAPQKLAPFAGPVDLFIRPGYRFRAVDALITNFHLPRSSLLMLVSAFISEVHPENTDLGRKILLDTYACAIREGYRFYSFGDAMLIV